MITIVEFIAIFKATKDATAPILQRLRNTRLSDEERAMLVAAAEHGQFYLFDNTQAVGTIFGIGSGHLPALTDSDDVALFTLYEEAFASLIRRGFVKHVDGVLFQLTTSGFDLARSFATQP